MFPSNWKMVLYMVNLELMNEKQSSMPTGRKLLRNENELITGEEDVQLKPEVLNTRALAIINRISNKLTGRDFKNTTLGVQLQVQRLILQATSVENLCQCYIGWCAFW